MQSLNGNKKSETVVSNLTVDMLYNINGLNIVLEKLVAIFQSEEIEDAYNTYSKFTSHKQQPNMSMNDIIII